MKFILALVLCALAVQAKPQNKLIKRIFVKDAPRGLSPRIIGGDPAEPGEIPYQIGLVADAGWFCGGSLIKPQWVLSAAHCSDGADAVTIYLGSTSAQQGTTKRSSELIVHPDWDSWTLSNDLSLVKLVSPVDLGDKINVVILINTNDAGNSFDGELVRASGWGLESNNGENIAKNLNKVQLSVISIADCQSVYGADITESNICCAGDNVHSTCNGDSGGPLVLANSGELVGVTSFVSAAGCASDDPLGFARVGSFLDWINSQVAL